jgi:hypothetical protein
MGSLIVRGGGLPVPIDERVVKTSDAIDQDLLIGKVIAPQFVRDLVQRANVARRASHVPSGSYVLKNHGGQTAAVVGDRQTMCRHAGSPKKRAAFARR